MGNPSWGNVYVIVDAWNYENDTVIGIYRTRTLADRVCARLNRDRATTYHCHYVRVYRLRGGR